MTPVDPTRGSREQESDGSSVAVAVPKTQEPPMYKVILHNDDFTPMDFVVDVLERFFHKDHSSAMEIMLQVHNKGSAVCGIYPYEVAETKVAQTLELARKHEHPLQCTLEKA